MADMQGQGLSRLEVLAARQGARISIRGVVQGVGFRPFVFGAATGLGLKGWVRNTGGGVEIHVDGPPARLRQFAEELQTHAPPLARIESLEFQPAASNGFLTFEILASTSDAETFQPISPDICICADCLLELFDPGDRRYRYPFINCTNCGPRFTIISDLPYDRPATTMAPFDMCARCAAEYADPLNRRFHAQPIACPDCGPQIWSLPDGSRGEHGLQIARRRLREGQILAIRGLGGFHLACDAANTEAVRTLRHRKQRPDKPFALMMWDSEAVSRHCQLEEAERHLLESRERPILILERKPESELSNVIAPHQATLGVMLPYAPLHYLLLEPGDRAPQALVMTSGNRSDEPIAMSNDDAREQLTDLADAFLLHDREIYSRCDDSVIRLFTGSRKAHQYPLRRARGYAPQPIQLTWDARPTLAVGAELKNTYCLTRERYAFVSQHIGDLKNYETLQAFETGINRFERLFRVRPEVLVYDLHPDYLSTGYALERAQADGLRAIGVQHHHAHIAACMAENGLSGERPVIGVAFDGAGYGTDGTIWGGEFLLADYRQFERVYSLSPIALPGGDLAVREPWRMALAWLMKAELGWHVGLPSLRQASGTQLKMVRSQIEKGINTPLTTSMGRLFDAVASLIGVRQTVHYEAQAAIELEACVDPRETGAYPFGMEAGRVNPTPMILELVKEVEAGVQPEILAARFHNAVAEMVVDVCREMRRSTGTDQVALSGGVWQNMTLLTRSVVLLEAAGFRVYVHRQVPANDGGLCLGQAAIAHHQLE